MGKKKEKGIEMSDIAGKRGKKGKVGAAADPPPDYETYVDMSSTAKLTDKGGYVVPEGYDGKKKGGEAWSDGKNGTPKEYDPTFNGPIKDRGCTDIICCILFLVCFLGMGVVGYWAYAYGDPYKLLYPSDSDENLCGYGAYENMPNLFFFDLIDCAKVGPAIVTNGCPTKQICVTECPSEYWTWYVQYAKEKTAEIAGVLSTAAVTARAGRDKLICDYGVDATSAAYASAADLDALITNGTCAGYYYPQEPVLGRCLPSFISEALDKTKDLVATVGSANDTEIRDASNSTVSIGDIFSGSGFISNLLAIRSYGEKMLADVMNAKWFILGGLGLSMVISFLWIVVMRWIAGIIVWVTIACFTALFVFSTYYCYSTYYEMKNDNVTSGALIFTTDLSYYLTLEKTWLAFGCTSATLLAILLLIILVLRQRILIAIALIKEGSRAIGMMIFTLLWPIWPFIMQLSLVAYWGAACLYLASTSQKIYGTTNSSALNTNKTFDWTLTSTTTQATDLIPCDPNANNTVGEVCSFVKNDVSEYTLYLQIYMLFMFFWVMNWIIGFGQMVLAGAFASYYWAYDKKEHMPVFPILGSVGRTLFYHTGSIAFGAFIIALIQIIRVGLEYLDSKLKGSGNEVAKFLLKCLKCCFWCLEKFMKMINKNAYIMIAVYGKNFCTAAKDAFFLIMRNIVRVAVVDKVTDFLMFMSKLVVTAAIVLIAYFFFNGTIGNTLTFLKEYEVDLNYYFIPIIIIGIGSFVIASCFFSVYGMAVDTLFLCFLEDLERNDGSAEKPYYMSKELKEILGKKNVVPSKED